MIKVAITGSTGLVGSRVVELLKDTFEFIPLSSKQLDITNKDQVTSVLSSINYDLFLHFAAYTNVDKAEQEKEAAYALNVAATHNILDVVTSHQRKLIYISTGFVFDGDNPPYEEDSIPKPVGYYGQTKYEGEQLVKDNAMIVRFEYPYRAQFEQKKDFMRVLKSLLKEEKELLMVTDSLMTPTFIDDIAGGLSHLLNNYSPETFHLVGKDSLSPFDAAQQIAKAFNLDSSLVHKTTYEEYFTGKAKRPQWARVISTKNTFYNMKTFEEGLQTIKQQLL